MPITIASTRDKVQMSFFTGTDLGPQSVRHRDIVGVHTSHKSFRQWQLFSRWGDRIVVILNYFIISL